MALSESNYAGAIQVDGLRELQVALREFPKGVVTEFRAEMRSAVEPARRAIESRMSSGIPNMKEGSPWIEARIGVSLGAVYIVPQQRSVSVGARRKRPNFAGLAMSRAYEPSQAEAVAGLVAAAELAVEKAAKTVGI